MAVGPEAAKSAVLASSYGVVLSPQFQIKEIKLTQYVLMRAIALPIIFLAACLPASGSSGDSIRVLVYNIHAGKDAAKVDNLDRVATIVRDSRADVVMLQEVDNRTRRSGGVDQLAKLRELTGYNGVFGKAIDYDAGEYGIAILSRWPIARTRLTSLPVTLEDSAARARYEPRAALVARIGSPFGTIRVVDTHLDAGRSDSTRVQQAGTLLALANAERDSGFTIVGGDLNAEPESAVLKMLDGNRWTDLFARCGAGERYSFPADKPAKRIDYLLSGSDVTCAKASVLETQASDHRPVLFEIIRRRAN